MNTNSRFTFALTAVLAAVYTLATPIAAQPKDGVLGEILMDIGEVEKKVVGLAKAMPQAAWDWRPGAGVRSTAEVFRHVAADNYFMPILVDNPAPADTGVTKEYKTAEAFEKRTATREQTIADLEKSFAFVKASLRGTPDAKVGNPRQFFGTNTTTRGVWIMTAGHLHEHLGQLIAYARSNKVVPPWSR